MALELPTTVKDSAIQQCLDFIARQFPVSASNLSTVIVEKVAELPESGAEGQLLYNEADNTMYYFNGSEWKT